MKRTLVYYLKVRENNTSDINMQQVNLCHLQALWLVIYCMGLTKTMMRTFLNAPFKGNCFMLFLKMRHAGDNVNKQADPRVPYSAYNIIPPVLILPSKHFFFRAHFQSSLPTN